MADLDLQNISVADLRALAPYIPGVGPFLDRLLARDYHDFLRVLYEDIDSIVGGFQENPELLKEDGEDRLTSEIKRSLRLLGYAATHDEKIGGHSDLVVRGKVNNYLWIGEAKIHHSYDYLYKGFQQLTTRYTTGDVNQNCGGMLIYIKNNNAASVVSQWRSHLKGKAIEGYSDSNCTKRPEHVFYSIHNHERAGSVFTVKHIGIILGFDPRDRR